MTRLLGFPGGRAGRACAVAAAVLAAAACGDGTGPSGDGSDVTLAAGQFALYSAADIDGGLRFPAAGSGGAEYLVVAQSATGDTGISTAFSLTGVRAAAVTSPLAPAVSRGEPSVALRFHDGLRALEARLAVAGRARGVRAAAPATRVPAVPPVVGSSRTFKVCGDLDCAALKNVVATARYVGTHAAIYLDDTLPSGGFSLSDIQQLGAQFDTELYPIDHASFGDESDVDANGVVIILLTPKVNALVGRPDCSDSFITGFFLGADLAPGFRTQYNNGEVFYGFVPDPGGPVSCAYSVNLVRRLVPVTFIHEFQHMISYNQHVLARNADAEAMWLNEALSHLAEELGGLHYDSLRDTTTASSFFIGNLYNAFKYLRNPLGAALVTETPPGELTERGAAWLFARYLVDRFGPQTARGLVSTGAQGAVNVAAVTGTSFATLVGHWSLAVYASDYPGFTAPAPLRYTTWRFRRTFADLHTKAPAEFDRDFPLIPTPATGGAVSLTGALKSGTGAYVFATQAAGGAGFALMFQPSGGGAFPAHVGAQVAVVRLQ